MIRKEFLAYFSRCAMARFTLVLLPSKQAQITIATAKNERVRLLRSEIEELKESPVSLMPDNLLKDLRPQEVRDLFAHLQQPSP